MSRTDEENLKGFTPWASAEYKESMKTILSSRDLPMVLVADSSIVAVVKPPRLHSAPIASQTSADRVPTLCDWVFERFPDVAHAGIGQGREGGLLHRLDYETSGIVLFARNSEALDFLLKEQESDAFTKEYLLEARPSGEGLAGSRPFRSSPYGISQEAWEKNLTGLLGKIGEAANWESLADFDIVSRFRSYGPEAARVACIAPDVEAPKGKETTRRVYRTSSTAGRRLSTVHDDSIQPRIEIKARITRGFRHQIRAHFAWIGLPIVGDPLYSALPADRLMLHAFRVSFRHPETRAVTIVEDFL